MFNLPTNGSMFPPRRAPHLNRRCRRGSSSPVSPNQSSQSSSEGTSILTGEADDLTSLMMPSDADLQAGGGDDGWVTAWAQGGGGRGGGLAALLEADVLMLGDTEKVALQLWAKDKGDAGKVTELYQPLFECVTTRRNQLYQVNVWGDENDDNAKRSGCLDDPTAEALSMPSLAVVVFLREEPMAGEDAGAQVKAHLAGSAWRFHHSEGVSRGKLMLYENNSQDYLTARPHLPLCAMRQIHCGKRLLRFLRFASSDNWRDNVNLYSLLMAKDPDILKADFCLFTVSYHTDYEVQLALKKIPKGIKCKPVPGAALCFRISQLGHTVPLLPNVCTPVTNDRWQTTDLDGNVIYLDVVRMRDRSCEPVPDLIESALSQLMCMDKQQSKSTPNLSKQCFPSKAFNKKPLDGKIKSDSEEWVGNTLTTQPVGVTEPPEYDSVDDVELLISDALSDDSVDICNDVLKKKEHTQPQDFVKVSDQGIVTFSEHEDIVKVSERDACGAVDGSSYHSEGNHEDQPSSPGIDSSILIQAEEPKVSGSVKTHSPKTEVAQSTSPIKQWPGEQKPKTSMNKHNELDFWASQSESGSPHRTLNSGVKFETVSTAREVMANQQIVRPASSYPIMRKDVNKSSTRPQLPSYSELENRKKNSLQYDSGQIVRPTGTAVGVGNQRPQVSPVTHPPPKVTSQRQSPSGQQGQLPPPYRPNPTGHPPPNIHIAPNQRLPEPDQHEHSQRFRFNGTTVPRFGRNAKWRQSVLPPPPPQSSVGMTRGYEEQGVNRNGYEEQAVDVPGVPAAYSHNQKQGTSASLGFYV